MVSGRLHVSRMEAEQCSAMGQPFRVRFRTKSMWQWLRRMAVAAREAIERRGNTASSRCQTSEDIANLCETHALL
ncbi:hypothetical protein Y032_0065g3670 [Ancylostoma ceylanicum]|uniref:Uncharacterized protein n=1 Tax=Ancylostoma ceylanicum TaxID=53326 RepID=A0A016U0N9_9BILA|nr:hypothetical protein Y032_0065g3670 [Ancylostoma ceylanicum]